MLPKAALLAFCIALTTYNVLSTIKAGRLTRTVTRRC